VPNIGLPELVIVLIIALVVFGPRRLPEMGQKLGQALREFKTATSEIRAQTGVDDIADSYKDIKSSLSLTSDSPRTDAVADAAAAGTLAAGAPLPGSTATTPGADAGVRQADAEVTTNGDEATDSPVDAAPSDDGDAAAALVISDEATDSPVDASLGVDPALADPALADGSLGVEPPQADPVAIDDAPPDAPADDADPLAAAAALDEGGVEAFGSLKRAASPAAEALDAGEGGVEAFGSLKRASASTATRATAD